MRVPVQPQSVSEILRASVILLIRLEDIRFGPWEREETLMARDAVLTVVLEAILKGEVIQAEGEPFEMRVRQRGMERKVVMEYYGLWSHVSLLAGARFVAFCRDGSEDARALLSEEHCEQLRAPDEVLEDVRAALDLERRGASSAEVLAEARQLSVRHGDVFARYVLARTGSGEEGARETMELRSALPPDETAAPPSAEGSFDALLRIIEDPQTSDPARVAYLTAIYEELGLTDPPRRDRENRLARTLFRLLVLPEAERLHSNLRQVYLPNLLGLEGGRPRRSVEEVFPDLREERAVNLAALRAEPDPAAARLADWLEQE